MADRPEREYPASYWRERADEAQAKAEEMVSEDGKRWMREIAHPYEKMAAAAVKRETKKKRDGQD